MIRADILPALMAIWLAEYRAGTADAEIVEVATDGFSNLFDLAKERLITAYGFPAAAASRAPRRLPDARLSQTAWRSH